MSAGLEDPSRRRIIMRRWIGGSVLFAVGLVVGMITIKSVEAQQDKGIGVRVNHVGMWWTPFFGQKNDPFLDRAAALKMKESQCPQYAKVTHPA